MAETGFRKKEGLTFKGGGRTLAGPLMLAALGGLLQTLSWPAPGWWPLCFVALTPLILAADGQTGRRAFWLGWVYGLVLSMTSLPWLAGVLAGYGGLGFGLGWLILILLSAYLALYPALFAWLSTLRTPWPLGWALASATAWAGLDWLKNWVFTGFNWTPLAGPLALSPEMGQAADLFGFYGLGFFAALVNMFLAAAFFRRLDRGAAAGRPWLLAALILAATAFGYGRFRHEQWESRTQRADARLVMAIQPAVDQNLKWDEFHRAQLLDRYESLARQAARFTPWLVLWPETALPFVFDHDRQETEWLRHLAADLGGQSLIGVTAAGEDWPEAALHNRMLLFEDGRPGPWYDKRHLVPFGEYLPGDWLPFLRWDFLRGLIKAAGTYSPGPPRPPLELPLDPGRAGSRRVRLGLMICFESTFPYLARERVLAGADLLVVPTNDGWFGRSRAPAQHLLQAAMRAIETRRPLVRVGNTGISAVIHPSGTINQATELMAVGAFPLLTPLPPPEETGLTFFVRRGHLLAPWLAALTGLLAVLRLSQKATR